MERINGYRNIGDFKKLKRKIAPSLFAKAWYTDGEEEYLFKIENAYMAYKELFYSIFMRKINFQTVAIDLAVLGNHFGIISKNYNPNHLPCYAVADILNKYWDTIVKQINEEKRYDLILTLSYEHDYNLIELPEIISWFLEEEKEIYNIEDIDKGCLNQFIAQVIGGNTDLRPQNMEIYVEDRAIFSPLYDFGGYGKINLNRKNLSYSFQNQYIRQDEKITPRKTIQRFLKLATKKEIETFKEYLELAKEEVTKIEKTMMEMEEQTENFIPVEIEERIKRRVKRDINSISQIK